MKVTHKKMYQQMRDYEQKIDSSPPYNGIDFDWEVPDDLVVASPGGVTQPAIIPQRECSVLVIPHPIIPRSMDKVTPMENTKICTPPTETLLVLLCFPIDMTLSLF